MRRWRDHPYSGPGHRFAMHSAQKVMLCGGREEKGNGRESRPSSGSLSCLRARLPTAMSTSTLAEQTCLKKISFHHMYMFNDDNKIDNDDHDGDDCVCEVWCAIQPECQDSKHRGGPWVPIDLNSCELTSHKCRHVARSTPNAPFAQSHMHTV